MSSLFESLKKHCEEENQDAIDGTIAEIVSVLQNDIKIIESKDLEQRVSDVHVFAKLDNLFDKKYGTFHKIAYIMYPMDDKNPDNKKWTYIRYRKLLSNCYGHNRKCEQRLLDIKKKLQMERSVYYFSKKNNNLFCTLKNRPISTKILNPEPMPVDVAPYDELSPFFDEMKTGKTFSQFLEHSGDKGSNTAFKVYGDTVEFKRGAFYEDGRIDLCKQVVGSPWIGDLMNSIVGNTNVIHFLLGNNIIDITGAEKIAKFIKKTNYSATYGIKTSQIKTWYLAGNRIGSEGIRLICDALYDDKFATALWLKRNPLMPEGGKYLGNLLRFNSNIKILDLDNTGLLDEGAKALFQGLEHNTSLDYLYLDADGITNADYIANYFNYKADIMQKGITSFFCGINRLGDEGAIKIIDSIIDYPYIERLCLGSNRISHVGAKHILESLDDNENLILLDIGLYKSTSDMEELSNNMGDESVEYIKSFIEKNKIVRIFSFEDNNITVEGLEKIYESFVKNDTILHLGFTQYGQKIPKELYTKFTNKLDENVKRVYGDDMTYTKYIKEKIRFMKHGSDVRFIDSIYRNKM